MIIPPVNKITFLNVQRRMPEVNNGISFRMQQNIVYMKCNDKKKMFENAVTNNNTDKVNIKS